MSAAKIGIVGCGNISAAYLKAARQFRAIEVAACADLDLERAKAKAAEFDVPRGCTTDELLADPEVDIVVNLTTPDAHADVSLAALAAGKHAYNEKPLAVLKGDGRRLLETARAHGLRLGGAPDTFLGAGLQTCRVLLDRGVIGEPVAAAGFMMCHGHESWHPAPEFYYRPGGGPMFDMGPYYLTALVALLGPVRRVAGAARISFPERTLTSEARAGETIPVEVPTHVAGLLEFASGPIATLTTSFDVWAAELPRIEIYGSEGTLSAPDPNSFGGPVRIHRAGADAWEEVSLNPGYAEPVRGIGVADLAEALAEGRPHRAGGDLAFHVLELMHGFHEAAESGRSVDVESTVERPAPLPPGRPEPAAGISGLANS
jgi:predicted dehydrogenase